MKHLFVDWSPFRSCGPALALLAAVLPAQQQFEELVTQLGQPASDAFEGVPEEVCDDVVDRIFGAL